MNYLSHAANAMLALANIIKPYLYDRITLNYYPEEMRATIEAHLTIRTAEVEYLLQPFLEEYSDLEYDPDVYTLYFYVEL